MATDDATDAAMAPTPTGTEPAGNGSAGRGAKKGKHQHELDHHHHHVPARTRVGQLSRFMDERFGLARLGRGALQKIFPNHWSFLLGEIALYSFVVLVGTGIYLTLFF